MSTGLPAPAAAGRYHCDFYLEAAVAPLIPAYGEGNNMTDQRLLNLGLNALARAHELDYFADGHRGASMVAAHLLLQSGNIDARARSAIEEQIELNWASSRLCASFDEAAPEPERIAAVGATLVEGSGALRQVGHDAIFAMLAIKGFHLMPTLATPQRINGVCALIRSITPWRDIEPDPGIAPPPFADAAAASRFVLQEASAAIDLFVGFGQGFAGHMLTFGQALVELAAMGHVQWAESCRGAFCKYVTLTRRGPEPESPRRPDHGPSELRPAEAAYWERKRQSPMGIGHIYKYPYSYYDLLERAGDDELARVWNGKAYHLF